MNIALLAGIFVCCAAAQSPGEAPPLIRVVQMPGPEAASIRPYPAAGAALNVIGMNSITGVPETWLVEAHSSFGSIEDLDRAMPFARQLRIPASPQDEILAPSKTLVALYRPSWSYRPDQALKWLGVARYCHVTIYRIRPGTEPDFGELVKLRRWNLDSINVDRPDLAYQVVSGAPSGTYVFIAPLISLRAIDEGLTRMAPAHAEAMLETNMKTALKIAAATEISREHLLFRIDPRMSYVSDEFASADPEFWRPKAGPR